MVRRVGGRRRRRDGEEVTSVHDIDAVGFCVPNMSTQPAVYNSQANKSWLGMHYVREACIEDGRRAKSRSRDGETDEAFPATIDRWDT